jgi:hypothetical protein
MFKKVFCYNRDCVEMFLLCVIKMTLCVMIFYLLSKIKKNSQVLITRKKRLNTWSITESFLPPNKILWCLTNRQYNFVLNVAYFRRYNLLNFK